VSLLVGEDLLPEQADAVRRHVDACPDCSRALAGEHWARRALQRAVPAERAPAGAEPVEERLFGDLHREVMRQVRASNATGSSATASSPRRRWAAAAAAALFCFGLAGSQFVGPWLTGDSLGGEPTLTREARPLPVANVATWDNALGLRPLGMHIASPGAGFQGLGGRQRATEIVDLDRLDPFDLSGDEGGEGGDDLPPVRGR